MSDVHTCGYYCDRPRCIKEQRDELRDRFQIMQAQAEVDAKAQRKVQAQAVNQQLPEGYVLVPIEPTEAMIDMGVAVAFAASVHGKGGWNNYMKALYRAFIAAAQEQK